MDDSAAGTDPIIWPVIGGTDLRPRVLWTNGRENGMSEMIMASRTVHIPIGGNQKDNPVDLGRE